MDHFYQDIGGWAAFTDLYKKIVEKAPMDTPSHFVEIGSWLGRSAAFMGVEIINSGKPIKVHCVDPWVDGGPDLRETEYFKGLSKDATLLDRFKYNTRAVSGVVRPIQAQSVAASTQFEDRSLDFVMIDGDHSYEACKEDIEAWGPKIKGGGILAGDDYLWPGVFQAVNEFFPNTVQSKVKKPIEGRKPDAYKLSVAYWWVQL